MSVSKKSVSLWFVFLVLTLLFSFPVFAMEAQTIAITSKNGVHCFNGEIAKEPDELAHGLMFRKQINESDAMLFDFGEKRVVGMWMKNTLFPLDILFIDSDGTILKIMKNRPALSTDVISSGEPVSAALELKAGTSNKLGLLSGDVVHSRMFQGKNAEGLCNKSRKGKKK